MWELNVLVLYVVFTAIFFYLLYGVIRAGVRDGIRAADKRRASEAAPHSTSRTARWEFPFRVDLARR